MSIGIPFRGRHYRGNERAELASLIERIDPRVKPDGQPDPNMDLMRGQLDDLLAVVTRNSANAPLFMAILQSPAFVATCHNFSTLLSVLEECCPPGITALARACTERNRLPAWATFILKNRLIPQCKGVEFVVESILLYSDERVYFDCESSLEILPSWLQNELLLCQLLRAFEQKRLFVRMSNEFKFWSCRDDKVPNKCHDFMSILLVMLVDKFDSVAYASFDSELLGQFLARQRTAAKQMKELHGPLKTAEKDCATALAALRHSFGTPSAYIQQRHSHRNSIEDLMQSITSLADEAHLFKTSSVRLTRFCDKFTERMQTAFVGIVVALHQGNMPAYITERLMREAGFACLFFFPSEHQRISAIQRVVDSCHQHPLKRRRRQ